MRTAEELRYLILAIQRAGNRVLATSLRPLGLTPAQAEVLRVLLDYQPLTLTGLGELLICEHGNNPSRLVDRLVTAGLVQRDSRIDDRRRVVLTLTADGETNARVVIEIEEQIYEALDTLTAIQPITATLQTLRTIAQTFPVADALQRRAQPPNKAERANSEQ